MRNQELCSSHAQVMYEPCTSYARGHDYNDLIAKRVKGGQLILERSGGNLKRDLQVIGSNFRTIAKLLAERLQIDCKENANQMQSDYKSNAKRSQINYKSIAKPL
jgi:hypothetical protein